MFSSKEDEFSSQISSSQKSELEKLIEKEIDEIVNYPKKFLLESNGYTSMAKIGLSKSYDYDYDDGGIFYERLFSDTTSPIKIFCIDIPDEKTILRFLTFLVGKNQTIEEMTVLLKFEDKNILSRVIEYIFLYVKSDPKIKHLSLSYQGIKDYNITSFFEILSGEIIFDNEKDVDLGIERFSFFLALQKGEKYKNHIEILDISNNKGITNDSLPYLNKFIGFGIGNIYISNTSIKSDGELNLQFFFDDFFSYKDTNVLDYVGLQLHDNDVEYISTTFVGETQFYDIHTIYFMKNLITSEGINIFFNQLISNKKNHLKCINLSENMLDDSCIESLGQLIKSKKSIEELFLRKNKLTDKGIETLSHCIIGDTSLSILDISGNDGVTNNSYEYLKNMVQQSSIRTLNLTYSSLSKENMDSIEKLLKVLIQDREIPLLTISDVKSASKNN